MQQRPRRILFRTVLAASVSAAALNLAAPPAFNQNHAINRELHREADRIFAIYSGHHAAEAIPLYEAAADRAIQLNEFEFASKFLINAGACQLSLLQYSDALKSLERSRWFTEKTGDRESLASLNGNIASLYLQMGNVESAAQAGERGVSFLPKDFPRRGPGFKQGDRVLLNLAIVRAQQHDLPRAEPLFSQAIDAAYAAGDPGTAAWAWDNLGYGYYQEGRLPESTQALTESVRLRKLFHLSNLDSSFLHLALVRAGQGQPRAAAALLDSAVEELGTPGNVTPVWNIFAARGRLALSAGQLSDAWQNLSKAVEMAREWRTGIVANDANRTTAETGLSGLYASYIETGNQLALQGRPELAQKTFAAIEENRAASLRALTPQKAGWRSRLPLGYWETLPILQEAERSLLQHDMPETRAAVSRLRCTLDDIEARAGVPPEMKSAPVLALKPQAKIGPDTVLMSFHMGERNSWVWMVTRQHLSVHPLPSRTVITGQIEKFQHSLREGSPEAVALGTSLYKLLFGSVPDELKGREHWLLSLDQELFSLPLSALIIAPGKLRPVYLGEVHALQVIPSAFMYHSPSSATGLRGSFLGVGDPIYNRADPRWNAKSKNFDLTPALLITRPARQDSDPSPFQFARLWGTGEEIKAASLTWAVSQSVLLSGTAASRDGFWREAARNPAVIHFATHILDANDQLHTGWIALSLNPGGKPEFLTPADISARVVHTSLVVLNGCSSGLGEVRAASGLMGLTRAWLAAGATSVLATRWPGPDDNGQFFNDFYRYLRQFPDKGPAYAIRFARRESLRTGGWRARPDFWASYFLIGNS